jgi:hypothetical protein
LIDSLAAFVIFREFLHLRSSVVKGLFRVIYYLLFVIRETAGPSTKLRTNESSAPANFAGVPSNRILPFSNKAKRSPAASASATS